MLTDSEREWLRTRDKKRPYCFYCEALFGTDSCYWKCVTESCAMYPDMKDAAEFSERVAAKLATLFQYITMDAPGDHEQEIPCNDCPMKHKCTLDCKESVLKYARLVVEEEMDAEMDK